jgi:hypothetical protein
VTVATVSVVLAAASVIAASSFYIFQIRNQMKVRRTDLVMRLYATFDSLEFQEAFHRVYWADFDDYDSAVEALEGKRHVGTYLFTFYDEVGVLLRRGLVDFELVDALLGNSARQLWEKVAPVVAEARMRSNDPRLYESFEYLHREMTSRRRPRPRVEQSHQEDADYQVGT